MTSLLVLGFLVMSSGLAQATLVDFQTTVQANGDLANSYTFDGSPLLDGKGSDNLSTRGTVTYGTGYETSLAAEISAGNSLRSISHPFTTANTVEYIFKTDAKAANGHVASAFTSGNRLYFGTISSGKLILTMGSSNDNQATIIDAADFNDNDWYYVAVSMIEDGTDWVANAWYANLTGSETSLTQSVTAYTVLASNMASTPTFGIGEGPFGASTFDGSIDDLNVYNAALSGAALQGHLDAILVAVPEPSAFLFMGMASLLLVRGSSRQRKD